MGSEPTPKALLVYSTFTDTDHISKSLWQQLTNSKLNSLVNSFFLFILFYFYFLPGTNSVWLLNTLTRKYKYFC